MGRSNPGHNAGVQAYNQGVAVQQYKDESKLFYMKEGGGVILLPTKVTFKN